MSAVITEHQLNRQLACLLSPSIIRNQKTVKQNASDRSLRGKKPISKIMTPQRNRGGLPPSHYPWSVPGCLAIRSEPLLAWESLWCDDLKSESDDFTDARVLFPHFTAVTVGEP
ncbi:unnamed protein product, partial [Iphiclides podalirius]